MMRVPQLRMELVCNDSADLQKLSDYCLQFPNDTQTCFPDEFGSIGILTGIWCITNAFVGCLGNLLTILAIPFAAKRRQ